MSLSRRAFMSALAAMAAGCRGTTTLPNAAGEGFEVIDLSHALIVIDLTRRAGADPDTELTVDDLKAWQAAHGSFPERCAVLLR